MAEQQVFASTKENATHLLAAAAELGLDRHVVKVTSRGLTAPDEVVQRAAERLREADRQSARESEIAATEKPARKGATRKTTAKKSAAKKTAASKE